MKKTIVAIAVGVVLVVVFLAGAYFWLPSETVEEADIPHLAINESGRLTARGRTVPMDRESFLGWVDGMTVEPPKLLVRGWAADKKSGNAAATVVVLVEGRFAGRGTTGIPRPDVAKATRTANLADSGFRFEVPLARGAAGSKPVVRVFAVSGAGRIGELRYSGALPLPQR